MRAYDEILHSNARYREAHRSNQSGERGWDFSDDEQYDPEAIGRAVMGLVIIALVVAAVVVGAVVS